MSRLVTTGVSGQAPRLEIRDLVRNTEQFSLYIQALQLMYKTPQTQSTSHFSISGIHGQPFERWAGDVPEHTENDRQWLGYCTHGTTLFPTWHRPYLSLYEQVLQAHAVEIAKKYQVNQERWTAAAASLRAPFWDWASPRTVVPPDEVISLPRVTITNFNGQQVQVDNPLWGYVFNPIHPSFDPFYRRWPKTLRQPRNDQDNPARLRSLLAAEGPQLQQRTLNLLSVVRDWDEMSNHGPTGRRSTSLEGLHDTIHVRIGGEGHMSDPAVASFDPIFYLHHASVDRLFAIWQTLYPDEWVTPGRFNEGSFTINAGDTVDGTTGLSPFWSSQNSLFNSANIRDWRSLGYDYPDFIAPGVNRDDPVAVRRTVVDRIKRLYGGTDASFALRNQSSGVGGIGRSAFVADDEPEDDDYYEWSVRVRVKQYALSHSFSVLIFLDHGHDDTPEEGLGSSYVGSVSAFVNSKVGSCENCRRQGEPEIEGFVHLNRNISAHSHVRSLRPDDVWPWLSGKLSWRVEKADGTLVPCNEVSSLEVRAVCTPLKLLPGADFPSPTHDTYTYEPVNAEN